LRKKGVIVKIARDSPVLLSDGGAGSGDARGEALKRPAAQPARRLWWLVCLLHITEAAGWDQPAFMIFTFIDPCFSVNTDTSNREEVRAARTRFQTARDAHFNLLTGVQEASQVVQTEAGMDYALFIAGGVAGLRYLIFDKRYCDGDSLPAFRPCRPPVASAMTRHYAQTLAAFFPARRNALFGYNLGDEPRTEDAPAVKNWIAHIKANDPEKLAYVNLLPAYGFKKRSAYEAYLDSLVGDPVPLRRPDVVSYDHYPFFRNGKIRRDYFYNLRIVREKAGVRPLWTYVQSADHLTYVDPTAAHLRFMAFCPLAYGAKGIGYFTYGLPESEDYRDALVNACDVQTPKYTVAKAINWYLEKIAGPVVMQSDWRGAFHVSKKPTMEKDVLLSRKNAPCISAVDNDSCLVGLFQSCSPSATWYCLVVNKSIESVRGVRVGFKGSFSGVFAAPSAVDYAGDTAYTAVRLEADGKSMTIPELRGGEGRLYRLADVRTP
jgi:hypothetical protein